MQADREQSPPTPAEPAQPDGAASRQRRGNPPPTADPGARRDATADNDWTQGRSATGDPMRRLTRARVGGPARS